MQFEQDKDGAQGESKKDEESQQQQNGEPTDSNPNKIQKEAGNAVE